MDTQMNDRPNDKAQSIIIAEFPAQDAAKPNLHIQNVNAEQIAGLAERLMVLADVMFAQDANAMLKAQARKVAVAGGPFPPDWMKGNHA